MYIANISRTLLIFFIPLFMSCDSSIEKSCKDNDDVSEVAKLVVENSGSIKKKGTTLETKSESDPMAVPYGGFQSIEEIDTYACKARGGGEVSTFSIDNQELLYIVKKQYGYGDTSHDITVFLRMKKDLFSFVSYSFFYSSTVLSESDGKVIVSSYENQPVMTFDLIGLKTLFGKMLPEKNQPVKWEIKNQPVK